MHKVALWTRGVAALATALVLSACGLVQEEPPTSHRGSRPDFSLLLALGGRVEGRIHFSDGAAETFWEERSADGQTYSARNLVENKGEFDDSSIVARMTDSDRPLWEVKRMEFDAKTGAITLSEAKERFDHARDSSILVWLQSLFAGKDGKVQARIEPTSTGVRLSELTVGSGGPGKEMRMVFEAASGMPVMFEIPESTFGMVTRSGTGMRIEVRRVDTTTDVFDLTRVYRHATVLD